MSIVQYNNRPAPFSWLPAALDQPYWDASDLSTMFQDTAGLVPASAPGQPIALMRDKSRHGINLIQPTVAARPTLARMPETGRRNIWNFSQDFSNSIWIKQDATITPNAGVARDGSITATGFITTNRMYRFQESGVASPTPRTLSIYARAAAGTILIMSPVSIVPGGAATVDLIAGTVTGNSAVTVTPEKNGYFRITYKSTNSASTGYITFQSPDVILLDGMQWEEGSVATPYQKVTNFFDVTESGVTNFWSLFRDPIDDALNANLPAGTYARINVSPEQVISFDEGIVINASVNILRQPYTSWTSYINRTLTSAEKSAIIAWWASR